MSSPQEVSYRTLFKSLPGKILVLRPGSLEIVAVTDEYLQATLTSESDILGRTLFEVFPDNPDEPDADGAANLYQSLQRVQTLKQADEMGVQRYPVPRPGGGFEEKFWTPVNRPIFDESGNIEYILHQVDDVTDAIRIQKRLARAEQALA